MFFITFYTFYTHISLLRKWGKFNIPIGKLDYNDVSLCQGSSGCRLHTLAPELWLNPTSSDELQISYQHNFKFLISLFRGFSAPLSPVLILQTQKNTKIKNIA